MILKDNLYRVTDRHSECGVYTYGIELRAECFIYKAHFPDKPITPGVCLVGMSKELLEDVIGEPLNIHKVKNVKFLSVVTPEEPSSLTVKITKVNKGDGGDVSAQFTIMNGEEIKAKISIVCEKYGS